MLTTSAKFIPALNLSHTAIVSAVLQPNTVNATSLSVTGGTVTADKTAGFRRSCQFVVEDASYTLAPHDLGSPLAPNGNEVQLYRGIQYSDGTTELVSLGIFGISQIDVEDTSTGLTITVSGYDRSRTVSRLKWTDVYTVAAGLTYDVAIRTLIESRFPNGSGWSYNFTPQTATTPTNPLYTFANQGSNNDPWQAATTLAVACGCNLFFDPNGVLTLSPMTAATTSASMLTLGSTMLATRIKRSLINEGVYNDIVVLASGTAIATPLRSQARDTNTGSPTYYLGAYGDVPNVITTSAVTTQGASDAMAAAQLLLAAGLSDSIEMDMIPNPALDIDDVVAISRPRMNLTGNYVVQSFRIPLEQSRPQTTVFRKQQATS